MIGNWTPIPREKLPEMIGKPIHLSWARNGDVWILLGIDGDKIELRTPKTHRPRTARASEAVYVRQYDPNCTQQAQEGQR